MAQVKNDNIETRAPKAIDDRTGFWLAGEWKMFATREDALADSDVKDYRYLSMTIPIGDDQIEYWFIGGIQDSDFKVKALTPNLQQVTTGIGNNVTSLTIVAAPAILDAELSTLGQVKTLIADIPPVDLSNYVTLNNTQTITGNKIFQNGLNLGTPSTNETGSLTNYNGLNLITVNGGDVWRSQYTRAFLSYSLNSLVTQSISSTLGGATTNSQLLIPRDKSGTIAITTDIIVTPDATTSIKGKIKLAGDLSGTADLPTVPGLLLKANIAGQIFTGNISAPNLSSVNTGDQDLSPYQFISNLQSNLTASAVKYPSVDAVNAGLSGKQNSLGFIPENVANKVSDLISPNANTYINTLGLSNLLDDKVDVSTAISGGYGITVGGDLSSAISVTLNTATTDSRYLRKDVNDTNGTFGLTLGSLITENATVNADLVLPSLGVGISNDILIVDGAGLVQKKTLVIAGDFGVADAAGTNQFDVSLGTDLRFAGANDTTVTFDAVTNTITFSSIPGTGGSGAVISFNARTGAVIPIAGDYNSGMVPEMTNLYFTDARVRATVLTGLTSTNTAILATDNLIQGFGKAQGQLSNKVGLTRELTIAGTAGRIMIGGGETQDLSANRQWTIDMATIGTAGTYKSVTTDAYGRVIVGSNPTTLGGFGITDAYTKVESDGKYYLQTNPAGYITAASLPDLSPYALKATTVSAGTGLTGGGDLSANRTISANFGTGAGTIAQGNDTRINNGQTAFGWGNHASAGYALTNGSNATGTWPISITGNSATATNSTQWNGYQNSFADAISGSTMDAIAGQYNDGKFYRFNSTALSNFISGLTLNNNISGNAATATNSSGWGNQTYDPSEPAIPFYLMGLGDDGKWHPANGDKVRILAGVASGGETLQSVTDRGNTTALSLRALNFENTGVSGFVYTNNIGLVSSAEPLIIQYTSSNVARFMSGSSETMRLDNFGNVGIGTTSPSAKLDVNGGGKFSNAVSIGDSYSIGGYQSLSLGTASGSPGLLKFKSDYNAGDGAEIYQAGNGSLWINVNSVTQGVIFDSGSNANFIGQVTAPQFNGSLNGNASSSSTSTLWAGQEYDAVNLFSGNGYPMFYDSATGKFDVAELGTTRTWLGLGSNAYTSTAYLPLTGGTLTGSIRGTSAVFQSVGSKDSAGNQVTYLTSTNNPFTGGTKGIFRIDNIAPNGSLAGSIIITNPDIIGFSRTQTMQDADGVIALTSQFESGTGDVTIKSGFTTNVNSVSSRTQFWTRIGDIVTVTGSVLISPTALGVFEVALLPPIATDITNDSEIIGVVTSKNVSLGGVSADSFNKHIRLYGTAVGNAVSGNMTPVFVYSYRIK